MDNPAPETGDPIVDILLDVRERLGGLDRRLAAIDELRGQIAAIDPHAIQAAAAQGGAGAGHQAVQGLGVLAGHIEQIRDALNADVQAARATFRKIAERDPARSRVILLVVFVAGLVFGVVGGVWLETMWINNAWHHTDFLFGAGAALLFTLLALGVAAWLRHYR